jgi:hypothetical protein
MTDTLASEFGATILQRCRGREQRAVAAALSAASHWPSAVMTILTRTPRRGQSCAHQADRE